MDISLISFILAYSFLFAFFAPPIYPGGLLRPEPRLREANNADGNRPSYYRENVGASHCFHGFHPSSGRVRRFA